MERKDQRKPNPKGATDRHRREGGQRDAGHREGGGAKGSPRLFGLHAVAAAWLNPARECQRLVVTQGGLDTMQEVLAEAKKRGLRRPQPEMRERADVDRLVPAGTVHQGIVLEAAPLEEETLEDLLVIAENTAVASGGSACIVVLDQVTDPHNVGAILRSSAAFGALAVVVTERHAPEVTGILAKTASGALEVVPLVRITNLARALDDLRKAGFWTVGLAEEGPQPLAAIDLTGKTALVLGAEGSGLRRLTREHCDQLAHLPTGGPIGSLNVSNAAAVALYEVARRR